MHHEIQPAPCLLELREGRIDRALVAHIAVDQRHRMELLDQRHDALLEEIALIGEREFGAGIVQRLGNAPGDRMAVGNAHDEAALALHESFKGHV